MATNITSARADSIIIFQFSKTSTNGYLAIGKDIFDTFFQKKAVQFIINGKKLPLIIVDLMEEEIVEWIN